MTFTDAAHEVLRLAGRPLHYKEITEIAIERNLLSHVGKSPDVTMGARLAATLKKEGDQNPLVRVKPGVFALREWDEETIRHGLDQKKPPAAERVDEGAADAEPRGSEEVDAEGAGPADDDSVGDGPAPEPGAAAWSGDEREEDTQPPAAPAEDGQDDDWGERTPDEAARAEIAAAASELFAEEDDDDQPLLGPAADDTEGPDDDSDPGEAGADAADGRRRRRRRRRRGSRQATGEQPDTASDDGLPSYTTSPAFQGGGANDEGHRPQVIEVSGSDGPSPDSLAGRELADVVATILSSYERTAGPVSLRQIADVAQRRGKIPGDAQSIQSHVAAATRADNARRLAAGLRPRFRLAGGRVGLTDWLLDGELTRHERDALAALGRYREATRRALARRLADLPGHSFVELCLLLLERLGVSHLRAVRFAGGPSNEVHYTAQLHAPAGPLSQPVGTGEPPRIAIVIRKDGRDLGRERVTELRGSAHHYGSCAFGWILGSGQILSGAREEASVTGAMPVTLLDASALARLCEEHGVGVVVAHYPVPIPDVDLFEALRSS